MSIPARRTADDAAQGAHGATEAAVDWMVKLRSGNASAEDRQAFDAWRAQPDHEAAWQRVQSALQPACLAAGSGGEAWPAREVARDILLRPRRRVVLMSLVGVGAGAALGGVVANRYLPLVELGADLRTGTAERRHYALPDGSGLSLNARSAADVSYTAERRVIQLRAGELVANVMADALRPFVVATREGGIQALGTRFLVRQEADRTRVTALSHDVEIQTRQGARRVLREGEGAVFDAARIDGVDASGITGAEWLEGHLLVNQRPLAEVIVELQRYRRGVLRASPAAGRLLVQGGFPLDDVDASLAGLVDTLPIQVRDYGGWLTLIERRA
ncbi:Fe2+-dicitrate sensor, membrane component [plant metagenome]|uniref:Fe2+-dicitrate sensor, membrane component n=2 Tax=plant metagenome TaxID=1297885 RepID=A0A484S1A4_9ZZZZ